MDRLACCEGCDMYVEVPDCDMCSQRDCALVGAGVHCQCSFDASCRRAYSAGIAEGERRIKAKQSAEYDQMTELPHGDMLG